MLPRDRTRRDGAPEVEFYVGIRRLLERQATATPFSPSPHRHPRSRPAPRYCAGAARKQQRSSARSRAICSSKDCPSAALRYGTGNQADGAVARPLHPPTAAPGARITPANAVEQCTGITTGSVREIAAAVLHFGESEQR